MREDIVLSQQENRVNLDAPVVEIPNLPTVHVRREGFLGKPNAQDRQEEDRLRAIRHLAEASAYAANGMAALSVIGRRAVTQAVLLNEQADARLPARSLAREVGENLTVISAQTMAEGFVALMNNYTQAAVARIKAGSGR